MSVMMITNSPVKVKDALPYSPALDVPVLMNSMARATFDVKTGGYKLSNKLTTKLEVDLANVSTAAKIVRCFINAKVGVDQDESLARSMTDSDHFTALRFRIDLICALLEHHAGRPEENC